MRFIYATRPSLKLEFATTNQREAIPTDADVYAVCDGALTIRQQDDNALETMSQQEQLTLEELITQSQRDEAVRPCSTLNDRRNLLSRILHRLLNW
jgi:hypothetical protein